MFRRQFKRFSQQASKGKIPSKKDLQDKIIMASLLHVNKTGFTDEALSRACDDLDLSSASNRLVEDGPIAIVHHILEEIDEKFEREFIKLNGEIGFQEKNAREREQLIGEGIKLKLNLVSPYVNHWDQAIALCLHPLNIKNSYLKLFNFSNQLLFLVKDESAGMDWYYQRQKVMMIHVLSELYMLTDKSSNFQATQEFVERRVSDFREFEKFSNYIGGFLRSGFIAKNGLLDMLKEPVVNEETERMQREYFEKMKKNEEEVKNSEKESVKEQKMT